MFDSNADGHEHQFLLGLSEASVSNMEVQVAGPLYDDALGDVNASQRPTADTHTS